MNAEEIANCQIVGYATHATDRPDKACRYATFEDFQAAHPKMRYVYVERFHASRGMFFRHRVSVNAL